MDQKSDTELWPCDWKSSRLDQMRRAAARPFREKLVWLEEMTEFANKLQASPSVKENPPRLYE